jgi:hypothetical protein
LAIKNCSKLHKSGESKLRCTKINYCCCCSNIINNNNNNGNPLKRIHAPASKIAREIYNAWVSIVDNFNSDVNEFRKRKKRTINQKNNSSPKKIITTEEEEKEKEKE